MASVRVAVRVRPLNKREKQLSSRCIVRVEGNTASLQQPGGDELKDRGKSFSFDFTYDSTDRGSPTFASQEKIFTDLGSDVLKAAFEGFNVCVFAYGQTGSGKSYTMMGTTEDKGLIPRICEGFFSEISERRASDAVTLQTEVSYVEIYNERVHDLLKERGAPPDGGGLRVREHPKNGPYVENLSRHSVHSHGDMEALMVLGSASRTTASTGMNESSSRSHAILSLSLTQAWCDPEFPRETLSKIHLVDLAGSERADATGTTGTRLKEGANINKSLVTLGSVISALADLSVGGQSAKKKQIFIPYRDSVLTWLLKDSLGGNSMTTMIATVSPAHVNYGETLSTLRYASRAKRIVNTPSVNEDGSVKVVRELRAELTRLRRLLEETTEGGAQASLGELSAAVEAEELHQNQEQVQALTKQWTGKWVETQNILQEEAVALRREGSGVLLDCQLPHLIGIDEDLLGTGIILYYLKEGRTLIGREGASWRQDSGLQGPPPLGEQCVLESRAGTVTLIPQDGAVCSVDGSVVTEPCRLTQGAVIQLGGGVPLRFNHPARAAPLGDKCQNWLLSASSLSDAPRATEDLPGVTLQDPHPGHVDLLAAESRAPSSCFTPATPETLAAAAIPGNRPVPHSSCEPEGAVLQGVGSSGDAGEHRRDSCHKSGPELTSERPWRKAPSSRREEVWSGDGSLQQTGVLGPGDGCVMKPEGNANEIQGVVADGYEGRPGSTGSSLGSMSHLLSSRGRSSTPVLPQTAARSQLDTKPPSSRAARRPPEETTSEDQLGCAEMDEVWEEILGGSGTEAAGAPARGAGLGALVSTVSGMVLDAGRLLWSSHRVLQQVREEGLNPVGARWANHVVSLLRGSAVLSAVKDSRIFSTVNGSFALSLFKDSSIFSMVKDLPLVQHIQMEITQSLQPEEAAHMIQGCIKCGASKLPVLPPTKTFSRADVLPLTVCSRSKSVGDLWLRGQSVADVQEERGHALITDVRRLSGDEAAPEDTNQAPTSKNNVHMVCQTLMEFPDSLLKLQTLPLHGLMSTLQSIISPPLLSSQKLVGLFWLHAATCSRPEPRPALLVLVETGLYALTGDSGLLRLFHHLPLLHLKEVHISLGGHSLRLTGPTEESVLSVCTLSQRLTQQLCSAVLGVICPGDGRVSQHPLLHGDLVRMSLDWRLSVPDLLLDAGLRVCSQFQRSLADLVNLLHCNMDEETVALGEVQLLLYTGVGLCSGAGAQAPAQLLLTDTHLGLVQEDTVFHPPPRSLSLAPRLPQFHHLTLRRRSDVRCVLVRDEDEHGAVRLDVILAGVRAGGHPEPARAPGSRPHAEVWKLTLSCSSEAACLINHLSNI